MAVRVLFQVPSSTHITPLLEEEHWLPVSYRIQFKILTLVYNALNSRGPSYISDMLSVSASGYQTRSVRREDLSVPRISSKLGERAFSVSGPKLWNSLPESIRKSKT